MRKPRSLYLHFKRQGWDKRAPMATCVEENGVRSIELDLWLRLGPRDIDRLAAWLPKAISWRDAPQEIRHGD